MCIVWLNLIRWFRSDHLSYLLLLYIYILFSLWLLFTMRRIHRKLLSGYQLCWLPNCIMFGWLPRYPYIVFSSNGSTIRRLNSLFLVAWWNSSSKDIRVKEDHLREVLRPENRSALRQDTFNVNVEIFLRTDHRGCFCSIYSEHHHTEEDQTWFHPLWAFLHYFFPMCWIHQPETSWPLLLRTRFGWS